MLPGPVTEGQEGASQASGGAHRPTNVAYVDSQTPILLQTARLQLCSLNDTTAPINCVEARAIMDSGRQRSYVTSRLRVSIYPRIELSLYTSRRLDLLKGKMLPVKQLILASS